MHFDLHGSELCCGLLQCSCYTEHCRYGVLTVCRNSAVHEHCWVCVVCGVKLCCEILLLLNMVDMGYLLFVRLE